LQKLNASTVALTTLITPSFAIAIGGLLNDEPIDQALIVGATIIMISLAFFQFGDKWLKRFKRVKSIEMS